MLKMMTLLLFMTAAVVRDRQTCRIPNVLLLAGAVNGCLLRGYEDGWTGIADAAAGAILPLLVCSGLFLLSMLGAGDVKLLMAIGIYIGPAAIGRVMMESVAIGAGIALAKLTDFSLFRQRIYYLSSYLCRIARGDYMPYTDMIEAESSPQWIIHFSVPIMLAVVFEILFM